MSGDRQAETVSVFAQWAQYYVISRGWTVFPGRIGENGEKKSWKSAKTSEGDGRGMRWGATRNPAEIQNDFADPDRQIIGVPTGCDNGFFVVDVDTTDGHKYNGFASLESLEVKHGKLPSTLMARSPSGSMHYFFKHPGFIIRSSTGTDKKGLAPGIDIKGDGGMIFAPPSVRPGKGAYEWLNDLAIVDAPSWLLEWLRDRSGGIERRTKEHRSRQGDFSLRDVRSMLLWMSDHGAFESYEEWVSIGQALKVGFWDDGLELWESVTEPGRYSCEQKWRTFKDNDDGNAVTLATWFRQAREAGWRLSAAELFSDVVQTVSSPPIAGAMPLMGGMKAACDLGIPIVNAFNQDNVSIPQATDAPTLPIEMNAAELRGPLNEAIGKMLTIVRVKQRAFKFADVADVIGVLAAVHNPTVAPLIEAIRAADARVPDGALRSAVQRFETAISAEANAQSGFILNAKGLPDPEVSENVDFLLRQMEVGLRFDEFKRQIEYSTRGIWLSYNDVERDKIKRTANSRVYNFRASKDFIETNVRVLARENSFDSLDDLVNELDVGWDGVPRLDSWIARACGVVDDDYHRMVGRNVIGGMIARARIPGCRHDESVLFIGPKQGGGKSEITKILALDDPDMLLERFDFSESDQNALPKLAGRWVVELSELAGLGKKDAEDVKAFLTTRNDRYTAKYDTYSKDHPRRFIFVATSNDRKPLKDESGNRRFLPVSVPGEVDTVWLRTNARQIIGETARRHSLGETFGVPRPLWDVAAKHQEAARQERPVEVYLTDMLAKFDSLPVQIRSADLLRALHLRGVRDNKIGEAMRKMGFVEERTNRDRFYVSGKLPRAVVFHENLKGGTFSMLPSSIIPPPPY